MTLQDALFNWVQIHIVAEARPDDDAARETCSFFEEILREDHHVSQFAVSARDETMIHIRYEIDGRTKTQMYDRDHAEQLLRDIESNPKYN
jgi:hypothetical protein